MRLVDADNARECFGGDGVTGAVMKRMFDSLPTIDAVPVVRRPVPGYEGYYEVDNLGRVFSVDRIIHVNDNGRIYINGKQKYIGAYRTLADAVKARDIAEGSIHDGEGGQCE